MTLQPTFGCAPQCQYANHLSLRAAFAWPQYVLVSEAGASVYSASPAAQQEFPGMPPLALGAVSIARRLQVWGHNACAARGGTNRAWWSRRRIRCPN